MWGIFKQYSWLMELLAVILCSYFLAKITGVYLGRTLEYKRSIAVLTKADKEAEISKEAKRSDYDVILERNIFDSSEAPVEEAGETSDEGVNLAAVSGEAVKTSLDIKVIGVLVVGEGKDPRSSATIVAAGKSGDGNVYAVGDVESFAPNTRLTQVRPDKIFFLNGNRLEYAEVGEEEGKSIFGPPPKDLEIAENAPVAGESVVKDALIKAEGSGKYVIDQSEIDNALNNLDKLYTDIRAVPNFADGKVSGMKILSVRNGSLFAKLGLQRGDVLKRINGIDLDVKRGFEIFNQLKDQKSFSVDLVRGGSPQTLDYDIR